MKIVEIDFSDMEDALSKASRIIDILGRNGEIAVVRALNRSVKGVKTDSVKAARSKYNIRASAVRKAFSMDLAGQKKFEARAVASGSRISLKEFSPRPFRVGGRRPAKGISVQVKRTRKTIRSSFIAKMSSGHIGVFKRTGEFNRNNNPDLEKIEKLDSLSVPWMLNNEREKIYEVIKKGVEKRFERTLDHEINRTLQKMRVR